jgi:hypothetical protein
MDRRNFLRLTGGGSLGLLLGIRLPKTEAAEILPVQKIVVDRPLTNITIEYMRQSHRIPFGPRPPLDPRVGDGWWRLGRYGHYEVTRFDGKNWKPVR